MNFNKKKMRQSSNVNSTYFFKIFQHWLAITWNAVRTTARMMEIVWSCLVHFKIQVNLFQKLSFLNQLTHNKTRHCSLNSSEKYKITTCCVQILFWMSKQKKQFLYTTCCELVFLGEFNEQSLVILWVEVSPS